MSVYILNNMPELKEIIKSINSEKNYDLIDAYNQSDYVPFVITRIYSLHQDTVLIANELNVRPNLQKIMQYKYYVNSVRKRNRYAPWLKHNVSDEVKLVSEYYGISIKRAKQILPLLSKDDLSSIKEILDKGGIKK